MALAYIPKVSSGSITTDRAFNCYQCHWIFQQVGVDMNDQPIYVIINKLSNNVLDHWGGVRIEAPDNNAKNTHHQWRLVPYHKQYFAFVNVSTGKYLYDDGDAPHAGNCVDAMLDEDHQCCWTLMSHWHSIYDTIALNTEITDPYQRSHQVAKRALKKTS
ncbi:hypothetical protein EDC04DRAFT_2897819 [Pisolithus marmoratus]|nr:hypothetical protein EDC04DRAFT_2897819 [Pisolithus marmoratus]